jgi:hypothetical protein
MMMLQKSDTNNAIITQLSNVRKHPNADRLKLATVLGTQVIVGLDAKDGDIVVYFDSNLRLSPEYLHWNNLYSNKEMNRDIFQKGYFGKNGRVRAQKFRGELSNGFVMPVKTLGFIPEVMKNFPALEVGDEFTHINGVMICEKYVIQETPPPRSGHYKKWTIPTHMFHQHWDTKQLMREKDSIPSESVLYVEEKIHGTSARTCYALCSTGKRWWQFWKPRHEWKVVSGTRRMDHIGNHIPLVRREIEQKVAPHLHKGEQIYYEIYGFDSGEQIYYEIYGFDSEGGKPIQTGFTYGCSPRQYKAMLYRVTITTPDGYCIDLDREQVYKRAEELGLEKPTLLSKVFYTGPGIADIPGVIEPYSQLNSLVKLCEGKFALDANTMREGIVIWFKNIYGNWHCLKHKSEEFLIKESELRDQEIGDVEDNL